MNPELERAIKARDKCLIGGREFAHQGEDIQWLMGWADNAAEVQMIEEQEYQQFLEAKVALAAHRGFEVEQDEIHPLLKPHQKDCVQWAVRGGRRALFESFGLGKTMQQLEILRLILKKSGGGKALIVCPLGVRQEFKKDALKLDIPLAFIRTNEEVAQLSLIGDCPSIFRH